MSEPRYIWNEIGTGVPLPPERRYVLVKVVQLSEDGLRTVSETAAVGWVRIYPDWTLWVVPGVSGIRTHWCDCLGDDFTAPGWKSLHQKSVHQTRMERGQC